MPVEESKEFKCRKRKIDEAKDRVDVYRCSTATLAHNHECRSELGTTDSHELSHCEKVLKRNLHHEHERRAATTAKFIESKDKPLRKSVAMKVSITHCAPLTLVKAQLGKVRNT